jgi:hypothetical protein
MNIGEPRRVVEIEPVAVPIPGSLPLAERTPELEPDHSLDRGPSPWGRAPITA